MTLMAVIRATVHAQVTPCTGTDMSSPMHQQSQMGASNTPSCISAIRDAYKSGTKAPASSAPPARTHTAVHLQAYTSSSPNTSACLPEKPSGILLSTVKSLLSWSLFRMHA